MVLRPMPKLRSQRQKLYKDNVPDIKMEIAYCNKETDQVTVVEADKTPLSRFNPRKFEKLYEVTSVQVMPYNIFSLTNLTFIHTEPKLLYDQKTETKSLYFEN